MSRFSFEVATPEDDAELRQVLAATPMPGALSVSFRREPSYFGSAPCEGTFTQVLVVRDRYSNRIVGLGSRSVDDRYVNGSSMPIGYLSSLRLLPEYRKQGLLARGYAFLRELHGDGRTQLYLTTIAEGNEVAITALTSRRARLPAYRFVGRYHSVAIRLGGRNVCHRRRHGDVEVREATAADLAAILDLLKAAGPNRQFFPCYEVGDFFNTDARFRDLRPDDLLLAFRRDRLIGVTGAWDQHGFRQTRVEGYGTLRRWTRPVYNAWAAVRNLPSLPAPGTDLRYLTAALPVVADDEPEAFEALLDATLARRAGGRNEHLLVGLHEADPLWPALRARRYISYVTRTYLVCWDDGEELRGRLDSRPLYLELGCL